ncbi:MAG: hypothetical protein GKR87_08100 [Kiritimatiellae bacterium]|nr:hypothetical protein [Kiritimatiellia bacterium]
MNKKKIFKGFPLFITMPFAVVQHESVRALTQVASWVYYVHTYVRQLRWNDEVGHLDFRQADLKITPSKDLSKIFSQKAARAFEKLLDEYDPHNRVYQWLLNFSHMTINTFPDEVLERYLVKGPFIDYFYGQQKDAMINSVGSIQKSHGIVFFDFDKDGDQDIYSSLGGLWPRDAWPGQFFVNESKITNNWMRIRLGGRQSNRFGLGAKITVMARDANGETETYTYHRDNKTTFGSVPYLAHMGLGDAVGVEHVHVRWPGQNTTQTYAAQINTEHLLDENGTHTALK